MEAKYSSAANTGNDDIHIHLEDFPHLNGPGGIAKGESEVIGLWGASTHFYGHLKTKQKFSPKYA